MRKGILGVLAVAGLILGLTAAVGPTAASAATKQKTVTVSQKYVHNWTTVSKTLKACLFYEVSGTVTGKRRYAYYNAEGDGWDPNWYYYWNLKVKNPRVTVKAWPRKGAGCNSTKKVKMTKIDLKQSWNETRCGLGLSYSGSLPFGVSVSSAPGCGKKSVGNLKTSHPGPITGAVQSNGGSALKFKKGVISPRKTAISFKAKVTVTGFRTVKGVGKSHPATKSFNAYLK